MKTDFRSLFMFDFIFLTVVDIIISSMNLTNFNFQSFNSDINTFTNNILNAEVVMISYHATNGGFLGVGYLTAIGQFLYAMGLFIFAFVYLLVNFVVTIIDYLILPYEILPIEISSIIFAPLDVLLIISFVMSIKIFSTSLGGN